MSSAATPAAPKCFISYSWDNDSHKTWVKSLATRLRGDGVDVTLDRWHAAPGDQIPAFMERAVRENDFVIAICTPQFKEKSDKRGGGVGYEGDIMTAYAFTGSNTRKFIPVLRRGSWEEAAPTWLLGRAKLDLSKEPYSESEYEELLRTLHGEGETAPPIGPRPNFKEKMDSLVSPANVSVTPISAFSATHHHSSVTPMSKIKVLFVSANPDGTSQLNLDEEIREITSKIRDSQHRDSVELVSLWAVRPSDLLQALNEHQPHIVHFSGHGSKFDEIILLDSNRQPKPVQKAALVSLFKTLKDNICLVVLNACFSKPQAEAISGVIDCTIGMSKEIGDEAAIIFAASLYRAIGFGRSIQDAFDQATTALMLEGVPEENTPELLTRTGQDASKVILVNP